MPERQRGEVPEAAVEAAAHIYDYGVADDLLAAMPEAEAMVKGMLTAAMDPALGDQRLVPLADVLDALREAGQGHGWMPDAFRMVESWLGGYFLARTFGGEPDER